MYHNNRVIRCCFCNELVLWLKSHNPWPASKKEDARCCEECNSALVIPARLAEAGFLVKNG